MLQQLEPYDTGKQAKKNIVADQWPPLRKGLATRLLSAASATSTPWCWSITCTAPCLKAELQEAKEVMEDAPHALRQEELNLLHLLDQQIAAD